ncbi:MAG: extracellular solute-binding protein [Oscillospiraceae bacterium]|jgi:putative aldouronate transport system substrate-binding protein|nr:extracellular solute-binding protein [Oscillospiraceae bacterium]
MIKERNRLIRLAAAALALVMLCGRALPASAEPESAPPSDVPLDTVHVYTMMGLDMESGRDWRTHAFFTTMRERTGIDFVFRQYADEASYQTAKDTAFASEDLPDVFFKAALTPEEELRYRASGQLIDLAPLLESSAPTLSGILNAREDWRVSITHPDGSIAALPGLNGYERQCYIWINQEWLTALNLPMPETFAQFADTLTTFRDRDPNGNGREDEIPLSFIGPWEAKFFLHAFGLTPNDYNIYVDSDDTVRYAAFEPGFREFTESMRALKQNGSLDGSTFRQGQSQRTTLLSEAKENTIGVFVSIAPYTLVSTELAEAYSILTPLTPPDGSAPNYRRLLSGVVQGTFAVTSKCDDPGAMLGWADYLYTEDGGRLALAGVPDVDYKWSGTSWQWITDEFTTIDAVLRDRVIHTDNLTPGLTPADFERRTDLAIEARVRREGDAIQPLLTTPFPFTWPTNEAREDEIASLQRVLGAMVDEGMARFIDGEIELNDENWEAYLNGLRDQGADRLTELFQEAYDERNRSAED